MAKSNFESWLKEGNKYVKVKEGERKEFIFQGMKFSESGGYKGKATVKYALEDIEDHKVREMSSSSKALATKMMRVAKGDRIIISASENDEGTKVYIVTRVADGKEEVIGGDDKEETSTEKEGDEDEEIDPKKVPF